MCCDVVMIEMLYILSLIMHDIGKSGWSLLVEFIPIVGLFILIYWFTKEDDIGDNKYGSDPKCIKNDEV